MCLRDLNRLKGGENLAGWGMSDPIFTVEPSNEVMGVFVLCWSVGRFIFGTLGHVLYREVVPFRGSTLSNYLMPMCATIHGLEKSGSCGGSLIHFSHVLHALA